MNFDPFALQVFHLEPTPVAGCKDLCVEGLEVDFHLLGGQVSGHPSRCAHASLRSVYGICAHASLRLWNIEELRAPRRYKFNPVQGQLMQVW